MERTDTTLIVTGMSCGSCVRHVSAALRAAPGVLAARVRLRDGLAEVQHTDETSADVLIDAVREAGYQARLVSAASQELRSANHTGS